MTEMLTVNDDDSNGLNKGTADDDIGIHAIRMAPHVSTWKLIDKCVFLLYRRQAIHFSPFYLLRSCDRYYTGPIFSVGTSLYDIKIFSYSVTLFSEKKERPVKLGISSMA